MEHWGNTAAVDLDSWHVPVVFDKALANHLVRIHWHAARVWLPLVLEDAVVEGAPPCGHVGHPTASIHAALTQH